MNIIYVALMSLLLSACGADKTKPRTIVPPVDNVQKQEVKQVEGLTLRQLGNGKVEVSINSGQNKVSAVSMKIEANNPVTVTGFETNKTAFNSDLLNKMNGPNWEVSVAAMRSTKELLSGSVTVGTINYSGMGTLRVKNIKMVGPSASGTPTTIDFKDKEITLK